MGGKKKLEKLQKRARKARATSMQRHVLVCTDSECDSSAVIAKRIRKRVNGKHLRDTVTVTKVDCLDICRSGPICVVYPEGAWYHSVDADVADRVVDDHLARGEVVMSHAFLHNDLRAQE
ncbi:MAG: (2Fe-2S) ferredoxin domain-containing protein [Euzebya sp.]